MSAAAAIDFGPVDLPGPTGEANTLTLAPRGRVLCLGPDAERGARAGHPGAGRRQCGAGGRAAARGRRCQPLIDKGLPIHAIDGMVDPGDLVQLNIDVVAISADVDTLRVVRRALAPRPGPIVPLVSEVIKPGCLCA